MHEAAPSYRYRRTVADVVTDFAEELQEEQNLIGRARHEPLAGVAIECIKPDVVGIEYLRTPEDEKAERAADRVSDEQWDAWNQP